MRPHAKRKPLTTMNAITNAITKTEPVKKTETKQYKDRIAIKFLETQSKRPWSQQSLPSMVYLLSSLLFFHLIFY